MQKKLLFSLLLLLLVAGILRVGLEANCVSAAPVSDRIKTASENMGTLDNTVGHIVDGVISPGEYSKGLSVKLVGRTDPNWTVDAYIDWDNEYLYVAVNEPVPNTTGHESWIEFAIDAGATRPYLDAFVLFDDSTKYSDSYVKPSGHWEGAGPGNFSAVSGVATEFKVKYTDYGITGGDTIKLSIDRNQGPAPPQPYGFAAFWPQNGTVYDGDPIQAVPATWGDIYLSLSPRHIVDGVISPGEYDDGMAVQLVGRTDPNFTVNAYLAWDTQYLYVGVNESVPPTTGHLSWIEFAIDAGPARSQLDAFVLFDDHVQSHVIYPKSGGPWMGTGPAGFLAVSNAATEFQLNYTDYGIQQGDTIRLSIDRNQGPAPPQPYGFAAFWPQNATVYYVPPDPTTWADVHLVLHDVEVSNATSVKKFIGRGYSSNLNVTVGNPGGYIENFSVDVYANQTVISNLANITLDVGGSANLTLTWETTGFAYGNYNISAVAQPVMYEINLENNAFVDGSVTITIPGDINGDFKVSLTDLVTLAGAYGTNSTNAQVLGAGNAAHYWNPNADINGDGTVGLADLVILVTHYGQHYP